jgi:NAD(P)-dependent dehydrogenase (short-subunit alcohol dehydrogenase family)
LRPSLRGRPRPRCQGADQLLDADGQQVIGIFHRPAPQARLGIQRDPQRPTLQQPSPARFGEALLESEADDQRPRFTSIAADVTQEAEVEQLMDGALEALSGLDAVI